MYRRADLSSTHDDNQANPPDEPQFQGVVFDDGTVAIRWLTKMASTSVWDSLETAMAIHGHPEYESELVWNEEKIINEVKLIGRRYKNDRYSTDNFVINGKKWDTLLDKFS